MRSAAPFEVTLRLLSVDQLFAPPPPGRMHEAETLDSGMDHLLNELSRRPLKNGVRVTIRLPSSAIAPDTGVRIRSAINRYCELRARNNENDLRAVRQDGVRALWFAVPLGALALALSAILFGDSNRDPTQVFVGEGLLLVVAWVALWYPAESLLTGTRPYVRQRRILAAVRNMDVVVIPADEGYEPGPARQT